MLKIIMIAIVICGNLYTVSAADGIETLKKAIETTTHEKELAQIYKKVGDYYVAQNDYKQAADVYIKALSLKRYIFSSEEKLKLLFVYLG